MEYTEARIDKYLLDKAKAKRIDRGVTPIDTFYPSSAGQCIRKRWNEWKVPKDFPAKTYKLFVVGDLVHEWLQSKIFPDAKSEVPVQWSDGEIKFRGRLDGLTADNVILEFKSIAKIDYVKDKPKPEHVAQLNMYLHAMGLPYGIIIYVSKNEMEVVEHEIQYSNNLYIETIEDFRKEYKYRVEDKEPKPSKCISPWSCEYCKNEWATKTKFIVAAIKKKKEKEKK